MSAFIRLRAAPAYGIINGKIQNDNAGGDKVPTQIKVRCLRNFGISLIKDKIYDAQQGQKGWFALIDETGEEYAYPPEIFEIVEV